jgi:hypothetical protein
MSDSVNPYQSPEAAIKPENSLGAPGGLTENMVLYLRQASPWLRFIGIVSFIGCGFMVLVGVLSLFLPIFNIWNIEGALAGLIYLGFAVFAFFPDRFIYGFGL